MIDLKLDNKNLPSWDLKDLYTGIDAPEIKKDIRKVESLTKKFRANYRGKNRQPHWLKIGSNQLI